MEGNLKLIHFQAPAMVKEPSLEQVAQSPIKPGFECFQGWDIHNFFEQPVPVPHHPYCKKCLPYIQGKSTFFELKTIAPCHVITAPGKQPLTMGMGKFLLFSTHIVPWILISMGLWV